MSISLVPYSEFKIACFKPKQNVLLAIRRNIEIRENEMTFIEVFTGTQDVPFYGWMSGDRFRIARKTSYKNDFKPKFEGNIRGDGHKTYIEVKARTEPITLAIVVLVFVFLIVSVLFSDADLWTFIGLLFAISIGYITWLLIFAYEVRKAKNIFLELTKGEIFYPR